MNKGTTICEAYWQTLEQIKINFKSEATKYVFLKNHDDEYCTPIDPYLKDGEVKNILQDPTFSILPPWIGS